MTDIAANLAAVRRRIEAAAARVGRDPAGVTLIAVSKTQPAAAIRAAIAAGVTDIGENYVQEAAGKRAEVGAGACWHLIGHLQRNKALRALETFDRIQTVDSAALGAVLARHATARGTAARVLIEVNLAGEASKSGVAPTDLATLLGELRQPGLAVEGLMTVPPAGEPEASRGWFRQLRGLGDAAGLPELSMGMSDDFEVAIEEGATMVRVGRAIFGERS